MATQPSILSSAKQFLIEALENHAARKWNFAIVHAVTAVELVLKERLARIHPALIFKNIDAPGFRDTSTVSLSHLPQRLRNLNVPLEPKDIALIKTVADWRNQIVHHMPSFDEVSVDQQLPRLLDFLSSFLRRELDSPIETFLPIQLYRTADCLLTEWRIVAEAARGIAEQEGRVLDDTCPACGGFRVLCLRSDQAVFCHLCGAERYRYDHCTQCGKETVGSFARFGEENYCDECIEAAGDAYIQNQIDMHRGK
jgi:hypothetical protein